MSIPLSILDLVSISEGATARDAIKASLSAAQLADHLGYTRLWFAEHHNTPTLAASSTALLIGHAAAATNRIRVGSGGVMLPNHSPLMVAEAYGTLANMHGDRIDLGLGRAPGTDPLTARALARSSSQPQEFAQHIYDLQGWFGSSGTAHSTPIFSPVSAGTNVPIWMLGSSPNGASLAGQLGLPFAIASHFAPDHLEASIATYRESFRKSSPTAQIDKPYVLAAINVMVAPTSEEAEFEHTSLRQHFRSMVRGAHLPIRPPMDPKTLDATGPDASMHRYSAVGSPDAVVAQLQQFADTTGADELIVVTTAFDPTVRERSLQLLADAWL